MNRFDNINPVQIIHAHVVTPRLIIAVVLLRLLLTLGVFPLLITVLGENYQAALFPDNYDLIASNLISGRGYRTYEDTSLTMLRSPAFVLLLAGVFWLFGKGILAVQVLHILMSFGTALLVYKLCRDIFRSDTHSIVAALLFLFHPAILLSESRGGIESTLLLCFTACTVVAHQTLRNPIWRNCFYLGAIFGVTVLVKPSTALVFPALVITAFLWRPRLISRSVLIKRYAIALSVTVLIMSPWVIRNYAISGHFVPTMTVGGLAMFQGVHVVKNLGSEKDHAELLHEAADLQIAIAREMRLATREEFFPQFYSPADEVKYYGELGQRASNDYIESPKLLARAILHNAWAFWFQGRTKMATTLNFIVTGPLLALTLVGCIIGVKRSKESWLLIVVMVAYFLPHLLILALARYHVVLLPLVTIFASLSIVSIWRGWPKAKI